MRRIVQFPAHYEVELRQAGDGDAWRAIRHVWSCGTSPTKFGSFEAARAYTGRLRLKSARVVLVERATAGVARWAPKRHKRASLSRHWRGAPPGAGKAARYGEAAFKVGASPDCTHAPALDRPGESPADLGALIGTLMTLSEALRARAA